MTHVVSMRLRDRQLARLQRIARRMGRTQSETSAQLTATPSSPSPAGTR